MSNAQGMHEVVIVASPTDNFHMACALENILRNA